VSLCDGRRERAQSGTQSRKAPWRHAVGVVRRRRINLSGCPARRVTDGRRAEPLGVPEGKLPPPTFQNRAGAGAGRMGLPCLETSKPIPLSGGSEPGAKPFELELAHSHRGRKARSRFDRGWRIVRIKRVSVRQVDGRSLIRAYFASDRNYTRCSDRTILNDWQPAWVSLWPASRHPIAYPPSSTTL
jgi:hypothetical protein